jgi:hypothetical protein
MEGPARANRRDEAMPMMTPEETKVLCYLKQHTFCRVTELINACLPGASVEWSKRVLANLEWLNNLTVFYGRNGNPVAIQITEKGMALARTLQAS